MTRTKSLLAAGVAVALAVGLVVYAAYATRDTWSPPTPTGESVSAELAPFYSQELAWTDCGAAHCAAVKVPIDYENPGGGATRLRLALHPATKGEAQRTLFVNPGGPGGSAIDFATTMASAFGDGVREKYDVVGVDPRGVGRSTPLTCLTDAQFDEFNRADPDPDNSAEVTALRDSIKGLGQACRSNSGELSGHVSTEEAARDMDVVRALLGRAEFDWFGASYGTQLGATYAQLFPDTVGRMVLDGAVDPSLGAIESSLAQATGFQRAIEAYADDCVKASDCPLGNGAEAGLVKVADLLRQLDATPMPAGDRTLSEGQAFFGIAVTLYDKETWTYLTQALTAAFKGDGTILLLLSDAYFMRQPDGTYDGNLGQVIYAINCLDARDRLTQKQTEAAIPRFERASPVFGRSLAWGAMACTDWPLPSIHPQVDITGEGAPPILVLGTTRDPATPYESAQALASQLESGVLVTRDGDGHTAYNSGNACITRAVDQFYVKGTVPAEGLVCR